MTQRLATRRINEGRAAKTVLFGLLLSGMLIVGQALAAEEKGTEATRLAPGDVIKLSVYNRAELTGNYAVGPDGTLRLPLVGTVFVAGLDLEAVQTALGQRISNLLDYHAPVTVDMARYRPVFVVGAVSRPGEHEYAPGLRVMQLVARAGGLSLPSAELNTEVTPWSVMRVRERLLTALLDVQMLTLRQKALDHLLDGADTVSFPEELKGMGGEQVLRASLNDQQALMDISRKRLQSSREFTQRLQLQLDQEVSALLEERKALSTQAGLVAKELQNIQSLRNDGLTTSARMLSQQNMSAEINVDLHRVSTYLSRVRQEKIELERRLQETEEKWRQENLSERAKVSVDLARAHAELEASRQAAAAIGLELLAGTGDTPAPGDIRFVISRSTSDGLDEMQATPATPMRPGDILHVYLPEAVASPKVVTQRENGHTLFPLDINSNILK